MTVVDELPEALDTTAGLAHAGGASGVGVLGTGWLVMAECACMGARNHRRLNSKGVVL